MMRGSNGGTTALPEDRQWSPHQSEREKLRRLRHGWAAFEKLCKKDTYLHGTRERMLDLMAEKYTDTRSAEVASMMVVQTATMQAEESGAELSTCLNILLNQIEANFDAAGGTKAQVAPGWLMKPRPRRTSG
jgi:hypothetical protein